MTGNEISHSRRKQTNNPTITGNIKIFEVLQDLMRGIETISLGYLYFENQCAF